MAKAIRKQTAEVGERWERLMGHAGTWQEQVDRVLDKLQDLQSSMDQLDLRLAQAEELKAGWQPVGELLIDSLQNHIDKTTVRYCSCQYESSVYSSWIMKSNFFLILSSFTRDFISNLYDFLLWSIK